MKMFGVMLYGKTFKIKQDTDGTFIIPKDLRFDGYGTATKPSTEEWILAMAPLDGTYAENALKHGLAGINVDAGRITSLNADLTRKSRANKKPILNKTQVQKTTELSITNINKGRWPADLILSHHPECVLVGSKKVKGTKPHPVYSKKKKYDGWGNITRKQGEIVNKYEDADGNETIEDWKCHPQCPIKIIGEQSGVNISRGPSGKSKGPNYKNKVFGNGLGGCENRNNRRADSGTAARFFLNLPADPGFLYQSKPSKSEKNHGCENLPAKSQPSMGEFKDNPGRTAAKSGATLKTNHHPTTKPLSLMKYLVKLLSPPQNPVILDMFAGSGTTGVACEQLKIPFILIEKEPEYCDIITARVEAANKPIQKKKTEKVKGKKSKQKGFFDLEKESFI